MSESKSAIKDVFMICERLASGEEPQKSIWTKIGVAFVNKDNSINVSLDALPVHGKLHIRDRKIEKQKQSNYSYNR